MDSPIRRLAENDAQALATFGAACFREAFEAHFPAPELQLLCEAAFALPVMTQLIADGAWVAGDWQGYAARGSLPCPVAGLASPAVELARLYVPQRWQGQGISDGLLERFLAEAAEGGGRSVWLEAYRGNPRALAFYRRWGFRDCGPFDLICEGITLPHLLMGREL